MKASQTTTVQANKPSTTDENRPGFRTKTMSARFTPEEIAEIESAAERAGKHVSEWLRETALTASRQRPADPMELLLAELWATRFALLNLFQAGAQATLEGKPMLPESVKKIHERTEDRKRAEARKMLSEFLARSSG